MDCREFQHIAVDLARGELAADSADRARAHVGECDPCAARLAAEERLLAGFAALKQQDEALQPSARLETALLEAFAETNGPKPSPSPPPPTPISTASVPAAPVSTGPVLLPRWRWWAAVAAAIAAAVWLGPWQQPQSQRPAERPTAESNREARTSNTPELPESTPDSASPARTESEGTKAAKPAGVGTKVRSAEARQRGEGDREVAKAPPPTESQPEIAAANPPAGPAPPAERELVTDFVPLTYAAWASPTSQARLVRVRLPSTALLYFGFPAGAGTATVEADVVLGDDGLAHAVRFVRPVLVTASSNMPVSRTIP